MPDRNFRNREVQAKANDCIDHANEVLDKLRSEVETARKRPTEFELSQVGLVKEKLSKASSDDYDCLRYLTSHGKIEPDIMRDNRWNEAVKDLCQLKLAHEITDPPPFVKTYWILNQEFKTALQTVLYDKQARTSPASATPQ